MTNNGLHSFYPGMVVLDANNTENLIATNHFLRDSEPGAPLQGVDNGREDGFGLLRIDGSHNPVIGNHFSEVVDSRSVRPAGSPPVVIRLVAGQRNYVAISHAVSLDVAATSGRLRVRRPSGRAPDCGCFGWPGGHVRARRRRVLAEHDPRLRNGRPARRGSRRERCQSYSGIPR